MGDCWGLPNRLIPWAVVLILGGGWWATQTSSQLAEAELRGRLLSQAHALADTIHPERAKALSFSSADLDSPEFQCLRAQMEAYAQTIVGEYPGDHLNIYALAQREGVLKAGPQSIAPTDPQACAPGTVYRTAPRELLEAFVWRRATTLINHANPQAVLLTAFCAGCRLSFRPDHHDGGNRYRGRGLATGSGSSAFGPHPVHRAFDDAGGRRSGDVAPAKPTTGPPTGAAAAYGDGPGRPVRITADRWRGLCGLPDAGPRASNHLLPGR